MVTRVVTRLQAADGVVPLCFIESGHFFLVLLDTEVRQSKTLQLYSGGVHVARVSNAHALTTWFAPGRVLAILHVFGLHFQVYVFMRLLQWGCVWDTK